MAVSTGTLPPALAPWSAFLSIFPRETADALGPMIRRISAKIGPMRTLTKPGDGDPDGFDGIARRGPFDRLLASEWALLDAEPIEFLRRVSENEVGYLQLARRETDAKKVSVALLDPGPDQLGAPRLAHLAALVVLARRAVDAGYALRWATLLPVEHEPALAFAEAPDRFESGLTTENVRRLIHARSVHTLGDGTLSAWLERARERFSADDLWLIGGDSLLALPAAMGRASLKVIDPLDPDERRIDVTIDRRAISLPLPDDAVCARLIRDPFEAPPQAKDRKKRDGETVALDGPPVFATSVVKESVFLRTADARSVYSYPIPANDRETPGRPKRYTPPGASRIVAVGRPGGTKIALIRDESSGDLKLLALRGNLRGTYLPAGPFPVPNEYEAALRNAPLLPIVVQVVEGKRAIYLQIEPKRWVRLRQIDGDDTGVFEPVGGLADIATHRTPPALVSRDNSGFQLYASDLPASYLVPLNGDWFLGHSRPGVRNMPLLARRALLNSPWRLVDEHGKFLELAPLPDGEQPVGVAGTHSPSLLTVSSAGRIVRLHGIDGKSSALPGSPFPIVDAAFDVASQRLAGRGADGSLVVYDIEARGILATFPPPSLAPKSPKGATPEPLRDPLTNLLTKRGAEGMAAFHQTRARTRGTPLTALGIELARHPGDDEIVAIANKLTEAFKGRGIVCRVGPERFLVLTPDLAASEALRHLLALGSESGYRAAIAHPFGGHENEPFLDDAIAALEATL